ncbi:MAG TPA: response regulator [Thermomonas sp.]|nr:response regulator [Thermomonas sp.]
MNPGPSDPLPRLLLVEDDPVSGAFLRDAASALPAAVHVAGSLAEARRALDAMQFELWLVDAHLPDGAGETLLDACATGVAPPALAHTAATEPAVRERLLSAGFRDVLCKPLGIDELHAALRQQLRTTTRVEEARPAWDDAAALRALGGDPGHVASLRALFLQELPGQRRRIKAAVMASDEAGIRAELHRLAASCGFVGAAGLAAAVHGLQASPLRADSLQQFDAAVNDVLG